MDDFDQFNQPAQPTQNTNTQEDDLFGSGNITNTTDETSFNTFSNDQQVDPSWNVENVMKKDFCYQQMFGFLFSSRIQIHLIIHQLQHHHKEQYSVMILWIF
jgi:hypothetical protein